jgi:hypothetical protein
VLPYILASDETYKARLRLRNETKPEGLYFGFVSEERFDEVTQYFTPPSEEENFHVIYYEANAFRQSGKSQHEPSILQQTDAAQLGQA